MARIIYKNAKGERLQSVTTILGVLDKPALKFWANKIGLQGIKVSEYVDDKAMIGTLAHYIVECHLTKKERGFSQFNCDQSQIEQAQVCVEKFFEWESYQAELKPIANELQLVSEEKQYGGCLDFVAILNGKKTLIDFKTCNAIYDEPYFQVAGGYLQLAEENGIEIEQVVILRIGRDEEEGFEYIEIPTELIPHCKNVFNDCLTLVRSKKQFEKCKKELEKAKQ